MLYDPDPETNTDTTPAMEKRTSWRDVPASLFSGTRGSKFLRIAIFVAACLVLTSLLSSDVRAHAAAVPAAVSNAASSVASSHASSGEASPAAEEPPKPTGGATVPIRLAKGITSKGAEPSAEEKAMMDAAGNSTLGFGAIKFINLRGRYDRLDAATLQAHLSGIDIEEVQGVDAKELSDVGLPPEHLARNLKQGEKGCWRAHADVSLDPSFSVSRLCAICPSFADMAVLSGPLASPRRPERAAVERKESLPLHNPTGTQNQKDVQR